MPLSNPQDCKGSSHDTNHLKDHQSFQMDTKASSALKSNFNGREVGTAGRTVVPSRPFPFQPTPSGNLKIIPNQVVYESKKVSVLVANPKKTKINVTKESDWHCSPNLDMNQMIKCCQRKEIDYGMFPEPHNVMQDNSLPPPHDEPVGVISQGDLCQVREGPGGEGLIREESESFTKASDDESEAGLRRFFSPSENEIEWNKLNLPAKTHMLKLLAERIANYVNPDIIVCVGNDQFNCHHLVLQCYSSFFDRECDKMVELPSNKVSSRAFSLIYDWMIYSGQDSYILLCRDNILEIFIAAQFLGIKELEEQCWAFIDSPVLFSEATAFMLYLDARKRNNMEVAQLMIPRVTSFFLPLVASRDFLQLPVEDVCTFLSSNYIQISCEMQVFMTAVRWLMYDWSSRACHLVEVMRCVRFGWIVPWQLVDIRRNPVNPEFIQVTSHPEIMQMVDDGVAFAIVHYWYGKAKEDECYEWVKALDLKVPHQRNWDTKKQEYGTYQEFLDELDSIRKSMEKKRRQMKRMHRMNTNEQISGQSTIVQSSKPLGGNTRAILENPRNLNNEGIQRTLVRDGGLQRGDELSGNESENMCRKNAKNNEPMSGHSGFQSEYLKNSNGIDE